MNDQMYVLAGLSTAFVITAPVGFFSASLRWAFGNYDAESREVELVPSHDFGGNKPLVNKRNPKLCNLAFQKQEEARRLLPQFRTTRVPAREREGGGWVLTLPRVEDRLPPIVRGPKPRSEPAAPAPPPVAGTPATMKDLRDLRELIGWLNEYKAQLGPALRFTIDPKTGRLSATLEFGE